MKTFITQLEYLLGFLFYYKTGRNVLLTAADRVKVIDFNLAVPAPYEQTAMPVGDMAYLAPEILGEYLS